MSIYNIYALSISIFIIVYFSIIIYYFYQLRPWSYAKNQLFFGLKLKYAVFLLPIPFAQFGVLVVLNLLDFFDYL